MKTVALVIAILIAALWPRSSRAEVSAILVGVADYTIESGIRDLKGPPNDVRLLADALTGRGVTDITLLADHLERGTRPTRTAILSALAEKAATVGAGDFVFIHLSGHGTRQTDRDGDETDGLDEVFLPADAGRAAEGTGLIENAILDDEIGAAVDAIRATGANVWLVMDSCNSGTGLRGVGSNVATRFVDPASLGASTERGARREDRDDAGSADLPGGIIAFYAAQSSEPAREVDMGGEDRGEDWFGVFTSRLAAHLVGEATYTFRQLFQAVLSDMNDQSVPGAARLQTPLWEGDLIDATLFGDATTIGVRRFPVDGELIGAGLVHGMTDGTLVGLVDAANASSGDFTGLAQLEAVGATDALLRPVAPDCVPMEAELCDLAGELPETARFAEILARPVDLRVGFAPPVDLASGEPLAPDHPAVVALSDAMGDPAFALSLSSEAYEVETVWDGTALWFGPRATVGGFPIGLRWAPDDGPLGPIITRIAKAETAARLFGSLAGAASILNPSPVEVKTEVLAVNAADLQPADAGVSPQTECRAAIGRAIATPVPLAPHAELKQCDGLTVSARGVVGGARDVNRIHIDSHYCINARYARIEDATAAQRVGEGMFLCSDCPGGYGAGEERMFVIVSEAMANAEPLNLEGLIENCGAADAATRGGPQVTAVNDFLSGLSSGRVTRGAMSAAGVADVWVESWRWTVVPKPVAFLELESN